MKVLDGEIILKFSDHFQDLPQKKGCWNCGFTYHNNEFIFSARNEISRYNQEYFGYDQEVPNNPRAVPTLVKFNSDLTFKSSQLVIRSENLILSDVRLFKWNNELYYTGTVRSLKPQPDGKRRVDQFFAKCIDNYLLFLKFDHSLSLPQKNWTPIVSNDRLFFENYEQRGGLIRKLFEFKSGKLVLCANSYCKYLLRGNCQTIDFDEDYLLGLYHYHNKRFYYHYFILLDKVFPFSPIRISSAFRFPNNDTNIQFGMGMDFFNNDIYISYGVQDADNFLLKTNKDNILNIFQ